jgi:hypothetical protein
VIIHYAVRANKAKGVQKLAAQDDHGFDETDVDRL